MTDGYSDSRREDDCCRRARSEGYSDGREGRQECIEAMVSFYVSSIEKTMSYSTLSNKKKELLKSDLLVLSQKFNSKMRSNHSWYDSDTKNLEGKIQKLLQ